MAFKNEEDHWAFLEEIEAPMWVDLTLETKFNNQDIDDKWFQTSHLFHQCSSSQLKLTLSRSGEDGVTLELDLVGASSPSTLPQSVSRSRGKDFRSKKWKGSCHEVSLNKMKPTKVLKGKSSGSGEGFKPKLSFVSLKGTSSSKTSTISEMTENVEGKNVELGSIYRGPERSSSPVADKSSETNPRSTVTSKSIQQQQQQKFSEVSSRGFGQTSELIKSVRISLRKSCITRPASRVEVNADRMESRDRKSSSSKSSVGSSSYSGYDAKRPTVSWIKMKEQTPDSRNAARMTEAAKNKVKPSSNVRGKEGNRNSRTGVLLTVSKQTLQEATKSKANSQTHRSKLSLSCKVNEQKSLAGATKDKEEVRVGNKVTGAGKENNTGEISLSQKCIGKGKTAGAMVLGGKGTTLSTSPKGDRTRTVVPKGRRVGNQRGEGKNSDNSTPKIYFR